MKFETHQKRINFFFSRPTEQPEGRFVEQEAHIEGALAAEASLIILDTLEMIVQSDGGGGNLICKIKDM